MSARLRKITNELIEDSHLREVVQGASSALIIRIFGTALGFLLSVLIARLLGADGAGIYFLATSVLAIATVIGQLGFENTIVRFVASFSAVREWNSVQFVYRRAAWAVSLGSVVVALVLCFAAPWLASKIFKKPDLEMPLILASLAVVPFSIAMMQSDVLRGLKKIPSYQLTKTVLVSLITVLLIYPFVTLWQATGAILAYLVAIIITAIVAWLLRHSACEKLMRADLSGPSKITQRFLFQSSWPLLGVALAGVIIEQVATILLGIWGSIEDVGVFNVAYRVSNLLLLPLIAMISILAPKLSALHSLQAHREFVLLARRSSLLLAVFALPVAAIIFIFAGTILEIFGDEFSGGVWMLRLLLIGSVINVVIGPVSNVLMMSGHEKSVRNVAILTMIVLGGLCVALIPAYGGFGAAIATSIGVTTQNVMMAVVVRQKLGFWILGLSCP